MTAIRHWSAAVLATRPAGDYTVVTVSAGSGAEAAKAGQYASVAVGGPGSALLLRRQLWIAETTSGGRQGGTMDLVVDPADPGGAWLAAQSAPASIPIMAPIGRPFSPPREAASCVLIGFGHSVAPLVRLAGDLVARGSRVTFVMAGRRPPYGLLTARRLASRVHDSSGTAPVVAELARHLADDCDVVYSAGPAVEVAAAAAAAAARGLPHQSAIDLGLVCGSGTCTACALPVQGRDGITRMARACTDGAVFNAELVRWDDLGTVPGDCLGAGEPA